ncbi:hypothetical protein DERP_006853 [Dermatophagoides pteronyssinus]|uniref:Uncharacterized protein n=1 Tax=Dermatophagoides pteronyssinus TaxID=6956 RepID=A0ABQ8IS71_DERPT|nr:hypothetical protein DERP_006853 [Dermatophagoides pteronyssinus]
MEENNIYIDMILLFGIKIQQNKNLTNDKCPIHNKMVQIDKNAIVGAQLYPKHPKSNKDFLS